MSIKQNLEKILLTIPQNVSLIAVSKTKPVSSILEAYHAGHRIFGENKAQELADKYELLPKDINWHFIGHLQTNKVKYIIPFVHLIHSVDSTKLLVFINKEAVKQNRCIDCLLQFYIATEESKFGFDYKEATDLLVSAEYKAMKNIRIVGVMGMATYTENEKLIEKEFSQLITYFNQLKQSFFADKPYFKEISMGMSGDYKIAIEKGSTMVRIGSSIFGERSSVYKADI
ncbi:MAG: YggS family pyridoxal phosphate-dependent enzyme [Bacteroidetes bacterium]|nr:YggS family pyridoxal phosphate-dependent enzyme [Bacteroidota bacterium]